MKILVKNYTTIHDSAAEFDGNSVVTFLTSKGDQFRIAASETFDGIQISLVSKMGNDQMNIKPRMSNSIEVS